MFSFFNIYLLDLLIHADFQWLFNNHALSIDIFSLVIPFLFILNEVIVIGKWKHTYEKKVRETYNINRVTM